MAAYCANGPGSSLAPLRQDILRAGRPGTAGRCTILDKGTAPSLGAGARVRAGRAEQGGRGGGVLTGTELAGVAPLWLEPGVSRLRRFARWLLLVVPAVAAVGTALAIALEGRAGEADMLAAGPGGALVYWLLYAASGIACLVCLWLIQRGLRRLAPVPATPPAH